MEYPSLVLSVKLLPSPYFFIFVEKCKAEKNKLLTEWQQRMSDFQGTHSITLCKALLITLAACVMVFIYDGLQVCLSAFSRQYTPSCPAVIIFYDIYLCAVSFVL